MVDVATVVVVAEGSALEEGAGPTAMTRSKATVHAPAQRRKDRGREPVGEVAARGIEGFEYYRTQAADQSGTRRYAVSYRDTP